MSSVAHYVEVIWQHDFDDEPVRMFSEVDEEGWELRKIEYFRDGTTGFADSIEEIGSTVLGEMPMPPIAVLSADPQFKAEAKSRDEFEVEWLKRRDNPHA